MVKEGCPGRAVYMLRSCLAKLKFVPVDPGQSTEPKQPPIA
jgi:hypothetical protein